METIKNEIDSFVKDHWSSSQKQKAETVLLFVQHLMNDHNFKLIEQQYSDATYIQHNRSMKDGITGVLNSVSTLTKRFPDFAYEVKNIFVDGDYVILHSHATVNKKHRGNDRKGFNIIDTWLVKDGKLTEHWDAVQPLDNFMRLYYWITGGAVLNTNGVF